jgi:anti-anti-sigma factor
MIVPIEVEKVIQVRVSGEIDSSTVDLFGRALEPCVDASPTIVVVNLDRVTFLSIAGLEILARVQDRAQRAGTRLCVLSSEPTVDRTLSLLDGLRLLDPADRTCGAPVLPPHHL